MNKIALFADSTCDLTTEARKARDIDYVRMLVNWTDKDKKNHEIYASLDWEEISPKEYIDLMRAGYVIFTSQVTEQEFDEKFIPHLEKGEDILYISCSSALSQSGNLAVRLAKEKYPSSKVIQITNAKDIDSCDLVNVNSVAISSGASTPKEIVFEIVDKIELLCN